jgi:peptidoglycan biosynthesis protein MviN/MurJ (putative lipid II flippase)
MARALAHLAGTIALLLTMLLWLSLLDAGRADRVVDNFAGFKNEYRVVLGTGLMAVVLSFVAAIRGARWWFFGMMFSLGTLGFFIYALSR